MNAERGPLGYPITDVIPPPDPRLPPATPQWSYFQRGAVYAFSRPPQANGGGSFTYEVHGAIWEKYKALGAEHSFLGYPGTDETGTPDGIGRFNNFQHGSIYWSPQSNAHEVHGAIRDKWISLGGPSGLLGYPITDEIEIAQDWPDPFYRYNDFQHGSILWSPQTGAHEIHGSIRDVWLSLGRRYNPLGYPITDETSTQDSIGRYNDFHYGAIYLTPQTGVHEMRLQIRDKWRNLGAERGPLGYPTTDTRIPTVQTNFAVDFNEFQGGFIYRVPFPLGTPGSHAYAVYGPIGVKWANMSRESGPLGFPTGDQYASGGGIRQDFERGYITVTSASGAVSHCQSPGSGCDQVIGAPGVSSVAFFNCHTDRHTVYIWTLDLTGGGSWQNHGALPPQYDESGNCPAAGAPPLRVSLQDGHQYRLIAVDPEGLTCGGQNDPSNVGCQRWSSVVTGASQGPVVPVTIG